MTTRSLDDLSSFLKNLFSRWHVTRPKDVR